MPNFHASTLPIFQTYILPAIPFRRRHSSNTSCSTVTSTSSTEATSPITETSTLDPVPEAPFLSTKPQATISCGRCHADLALTSQIISKGFTGRHGRAYLVAATDPTSLPSPTSTLHSPSKRMMAGMSASDFAASTPDAEPSPFSSVRGSPSNLPNTHIHKPMSRHLVTGLHTVSDVSCAVCGSVLGWKYVGAEEEAQRYKVGKFILESRRTVVETCWEDRENDRDDDEELGGVSLPRSEDETMFDSQDDDECEGLFAGVWSPQGARRRRMRRFR